MSCSFIGSAFFDRRPRWRTRRGKIKTGMSQLANGWVQGPAYAAEGAVRYFGKGRRAAPQG